MKLCLYILWWWELRMRAAVVCSYLDVNDRYQPLPVPAGECTCVSRAECSGAAMIFKKKWFQDRAPAVVVPVSCRMCYHCPVWTKPSSVTGLGTSISKQLGSYWYAHVTPLSLMGSLLQMTPWEQAVKICSWWRQRLLSVCPASWSQNVREKDAEGSGSLVQILPELCLPSPGTSPYVA